MIEDENKEIVGSVGNIPLLYEFEGRRILAVSGRGFVTEPGYRSTSLLLLDRLINQPGVELFLGNSITAESAPSFSAFECLPVPVGLWDECAFWITHYQGFIASFLAMKHYPLARPLSYPLSAAAFLKDSLTKKALTQGDVEVKACPVFDDRFDGFWEDMKRNYPHVLLAVRTREVLEWHWHHEKADCEARDRGWEMLCRNVVGFQLRRHAHEFRQRTGAHLAHHPGAVSLDGFLGHAEPLARLLV